MCRLRQAVAGSLPPPGPQLRETPVPLTLRGHLGSADGHCN